MSSLSEKVAIVTGASSGIGREVAVALGELGGRVVVNYSASQQGAQETAQLVEQASGTALLVQADISQRSECQRLVRTAAQKWDRVDMLVNNAGVTAPARLEDLDAVREDDWDRIFAVNVKGAFFMCQAAASWLRESRGVIVNVSSIAGINGGGSSLAYSASKAALNNLTLSLARGLAPEVRVNGVAPGFVDSPWIAKYFGKRADSVRKLARSRTPTGELTRPRQVADLVVALLTGLEQVSGQTLVIDGGYSNA